MKTTALTKNLQFRDMGRCKKIDTSPKKEMIYAKTNTV